MAYPFVPSYHDYGPRNAVIKPLAINVHMAEGGGTVGFLSRANPNKVSVHYVIEYGGRIVQMLHESHVNGSINPRDIRTTDDPPYTFRGETITYGVTAAKKALGTWWGDPNRATIGIEIEGFAKDGPNSVQASALVRLVADIRTRQPGAPLVGHRDFADYKACPGKRIDWGALGGHGIPQEEDMGPDHYILGAAPGTVTIAPERGLINTVTGEAVVPPADARTFRTPARGSLRLTPEGGDKPIERRTGHYVNFGPKGEAVLHLLLDDTRESFVADVQPTTPTTEYAVETVTTVGGKEVVDGKVTLP